jgi:hypothetical protein
MAVAGTSETSVNFTRLLSAKSQKTAINLHFITQYVHWGSGSHPFENRIVFVYLAGANSAWLVVAAALLATSFRLSLLRPPRLV